MGAALGIDFGTSGCRAIVIDDQGTILAEAARSLPLTQQADRRSEQSPLDWWKTFTQVLTQLGANIDLKSITSIAIDGTSATLLLVDRQGNPLTHALMYNDQRATNEAAELKSLRSNNGLFNASSSLAKLLWLHRNGFTKKAYCALHQSDWITAKLTGLYHFSDENNSLKLGYDPISRQWPKWIQNLEFGATLLPKVTLPGTIIGTIAPSMASHLALSPKTQVVAGTTDSTAAFIASGATQPGDAVTSLGSTLVLKILSEKPVFSEKHGIYSHRLGDLWLVGGASNSGGTVLLQHFTEQQLDAMTPKLKPHQPTGLHYYPLPTIGERFPINDTEMAPKLAPQPDNELIFFQAILEGISNIEKLGYQRLTELGAPALSSIRSMGKGASNPAWSIIRHNKLNTPQLKVIHPQAAYGSALIAQALAFHSNS